MLIDIKLFDCNDLTSLFVHRMNLKSVFSSKIKFCFQEKKKKKKKKWSITNLTFTIENLIEYMLAHSYCYSQ